MSDKNKKRLMILAGIVAVAILIWLLLKKNPQLANQVQQIANNLGLPVLDLVPGLDLAPSEYGDVDIGYSPAQMPGVEALAGGYAACNFCSQSEAQIATPSPPAVAQPVPAQIIMKQQATKALPRFSAGSVPTQSRRCYFPFGGTYPC